MKKAISISTTFRRFALPGLLILLAALGGCATSTPAPTASPTPAELIPPPISTPAPTVAVDECGYPIGMEPPVPCVTAAAPVEAPAYPVPPGTDTPAPATQEPTPIIPVTAPSATPTAAPVEEMPEGLLTAFRDCARTPGLVSCDPGAVPLAGSLAFYDGEARRLVGLDLESGLGWQITMRAPARWLAWSPDGAALLAALGGEPGGAYGVYRRDGSAVETFVQPGGAPAPAWQGGLLVKNGIVRSPDGDRAILLKTGGGWELRYRRGAQGEDGIALDSFDPDRVYSLIDWVPGRRWLLLQTYLASGAALQQGAVLLAFNVDSGELLTLEPYTPLDRDAFAFQPGNSRVLAAIVSSGEPAGPESFRRLVLYDFDTAEKRLPLPDEAAVTGLAWRPDGEQLALAVSELPGEAPASARAQFPHGGIYLLDPQTGIVEPLTAAPESAADGWPQWSADGSVLLYTRAFFLDTGETAVEVRERHMSDGAEWVLAAGLPAPESAAGRIPWRRFLAFGRR